MDDIDVRPASPVDAEAVAIYHGRCFRTTYAAQLAAGEIVALPFEGIRRQFASWFMPASGFDTRVAVTDGGPVGHVTVSAHQLVNLFVTPERQGTGLGARLLAIGESMIAERGHRRFELHVRVENRAAVAFYEAHGWTMTDEVVTTVELGLSYDEHVMVKDASDGP